MVKKRGWVWAVLLASGLWVNSCSSEDDGITDAGHDGGNPTNINCSGYCTQRVSCDGDNYQECLTLCATKNDAAQDNYKRAVNICIGTTCTPDAGTCCQDFSDCMNQAQSSCTQPGNSNTAVTAACNKLVSCAFFPNTTACINNLGTSITMALLCMTTQGVQDAAACFAGINCASAQTEFPACMGLSGN
jgi:hypothetical protein